MSSGTRNLQPGDENESVRMSSSPNHHDGVEVNLRDHTSMPTSLTQDTVEDNRQNPVYTPFSSAIANHEYHPTFTLAGTIARHSHMMRTRGRAPRPGYFEDDTQSMSALTPNQVPVRLQSEYRAIGSSSSLQTRLESDGTQDRSALLTMSSRESFHLAIDEQVRMTSPTRSTSTPLEGNERGPTNTPRSSNLTSLGNNDESAIDNAEPACAICYSSEFENMTMTQPCNHSFCYACITQWTNKEHKTTCPCCRERVLALRHSFTETGAYTTEYIVLSLENWRIEFRRLWNENERLNREHQEFTDRYARLISNPNLYDAHTRQQVPLSGLEPFMRPDDAEFIDIDDVLRTRRESRLRATRESLLRVVDPNSGFIINSRREQEPGRFDDRDSSETPSSFIRRQQQREQAPSPEPAPVSQDHTVFFQAIADIRRNRAPSNVSPPDLSQVHLRRQNDINPSHYAMQPDYFNERGLSPLIPRRVREVYPRGQGREDARLGNIRMARYGSHEDSTQLNTSTQQSELPSITSSENYEPILSNSSHRMTASRAPPPSSRVGYNPVPRAPNQTPSFPPSSSMISTRTPNSLSRARPQSLRSNDTTHLRSMMEEPPRSSTQRPQNLQTRVYERETGSESPKSNVQGSIEK